MPSMANWITSARAGHLSCGRAHQKMIVKRSRGPSPLPFLPPFLLLPPLVVGGPGVHTHACGAWMSGGGMPASHQDLIMHCVPHKGKQASHASTHEGCGSPAKQEAHSSFLNNCICSIFSTGG